MGDQKLSVLFICGRDDPVCEFGKTAETDAKKMSQLGHFVTEVYVGNCRHEFLNEVPHIRDIGIKQVVAWLSQVLLRNRTD
jgi:alpha-beta hydrolase superfamily lysophospholipase